ncbi:ATP-binding protein [Methyloversatilis thermotolerans]|uniref:ATP-binding protein n=1 Tax=Methyloversatilis thermotolerans TaxID=1346290 RepID=UPI0003718A35|nr:ATP-binding protein [Methyloversatilis thermotolerans]
MRTGLRLRIVLIASAVLVCAMLANMLASGYFFTRAQTASHATGAQAIARVVAGQLERVLFLGIALEELQGFERQCAEAVQRNTDLAFTFVRSRRGELLFHSAQVTDHAVPDIPDALNAKLASGATRFADPSTHTHVVTAPVTDPRGEEIADVVVGFRQEVIARESRSLMLVTGALDVLILVSALMLLGFMLSRFVLRPFNRMVDLLERMQPGDEACTRLPVQAAGELDRVARSVNHLLDRIEGHQTELRTQRDAAEQANRAKSDFLAIMSHEIRTPMHAMLGMSEVLLRTRLDGRQTAYVHRIRRAGRGLLAVIDDLLDFSRIDGGGLTLSKVDIDLRAVIDDAIDTLEGSARSKGLRIQYARPVSPVPVHADPTRLLQILLNLLGNAIKFTSRGEVRLLLEAGHAETNPAGISQRHIILRIEDTGPGIADDQLARIQEPFTQADGVTTRRHGGSGLGLSIVKRLVDLMGGRFSLESPPGQGTAVTLELNLEAARTPVRAPDDPPADASGPLTGLRVLLAEDDPVNQEVACSLLGDSGCSVMVVEDGAQAVQACARGQVDLVLMDCHMPNTDGFEATRAIRAAEAPGRRIPIIAATADVGSHTRARCIEAGMDDYLAKPFDLRSLVELLLRWRPQASLISADDATDSGAEPPVIDPVPLAQIASLRLAAERRLVERTVALFMKEMPGLLARIDQGVSGNRTDDIREAAHRIKSSAANIGAALLSSLASELERRAVDDTATGGDFAALAHAMHNAFDEAALALRQHLPDTQTLP